MVVGAGLVGLSAAYAILERSPRTRLTVIEKESKIAQHQSSRNSGVLHSGLYYPPGSAKARFCREGRARLLEFCREFDVRHDVCGKFVVATTETELKRLASLRERGAANGVWVEEVDGDQIRAREPHCSALAGLWVADTGVVDYGAVAARLRAQIERLGGEVELERRFVAAKEAEGRVEVETSSGSLEVGHLVNCAGLYSDRVARASGLEPRLSIVPFRGDYVRLAAHARHLCRGLIYPVPDPAFPFLGVHFTRTLDGEVECGPSAVLAFAREGYRPSTVRPADLIETLSYPGFWRLAARHPRTGATELLRTFSRRRFVAALQRLIPEVTMNDVVPAPAGVRAQALRPDGSLEDDFVLERTDCMTHVLNAPSPAATSSLAIGDAIASALANRPTSG